MFSRLSSRTAPINLFAVVGVGFSVAAIAFSVAGCGSSSPRPGTSAGATSGTASASPSATTTTLSSGAAATASPSPRGVVTSAPGEVKKLLALAKPGTTITSQGTVPGWAPANGSAIPADPSHISGFGFVSQKAAGIQYLSFAVK